MDREDLLTTRQVATALGISERRVRALAVAGTLPATRLRREWAIRAADLAAYRPRRRGPGRPGPRTTREEDGS